jgi:hypothetical protein
MGKDDKIPEQEEPQQSGKEADQPAAPYPKGDKGTNKAVDSVMSKYMFDPEQMRGEMSDLVHAHEDDETEQNLMDLYAGIGENANELISFDPEFNIPPEGIEKLTAAMDALGYELFEVLDEHYKSLTQDVGRLFGALKKLGVNFVARPTKEGYRYNPQFRIILANILRKMTRGWFDVNMKKLEVLSEIYKEAGTETKEIVDIQGDLRVKFNLSEDQARGEVERVALITFLKQLGSETEEFSEETDRKLETTYTELFDETKKENCTAHFLAYLIKTILMHQQSGISAQLLNGIGSDEGLEMGMASEDEESGTIIPNPANELEYLLAGTVMIIHVMKIVKQLRKLLRLRNKAE